MNSGEVVEEEKRAANRARMPAVAALVDELRAQGITAKVLYARENGITLGRNPRYAEVFTIPPRYRQATHIEKAKR